MNSRHTVDTITSDDLDELYDGIDRVHAIHAPADDWSWSPFGCQHNGEHKQLCRECRTCYPCPTIAALATPGPAATEATEPVVPRDPCPHCEGSPALIPRAAMAEHVATVHPETQP